MHVYTHINVTDGKSLNAIYIHVYMYIYINIQDRCRSILILRGKIRAKEGRGDIQISKKFIHTKKNPKTSFAPANFKLDLKIEK